MKHCFDMKLPQYKYYTDYGVEKYRDDYINGVYMSDLNELLVTCAGPNRL